MTTPIATLQLRSISIPRNAVIELLERQLNRSLTYEHRHYLANVPVHCGETLEIYVDGHWIPGRYEWTGRLNDEPTLETSDRVFFIDALKLLRWPQ